MRQKRRRSAAKEHDAAGRVTGETSTIGATRALSFQYDAASNRMRVSWPDSVFFQYVYDAADWLDLIQENGDREGHHFAADGHQGRTTIANFDYDPLSRRTLVTRGNDATSRYAYGAASRLTGLSHNFEAAAVANDQAFGFAYTAAAQLFSRATHERRQPLERAKPFAHLLAPGMYLRGERAMTAGQFNDHHARCVALR